MRRLNLPAYVSSILNILLFAVMANAESKSGGMMLGRTFADAGTFDTPLEFELERRRGASGDVTLVSGISSSPAELDVYSTDWNEANSCTTDLCPACDACPSHGMYAFVGYDSFQGVQDDGWGNAGLSTGLNFGTRLGPISDWTGVGFQIGSSFGIFNWNGTDYHLSRQDQSTNQGFLTYGFFRKADEHTNWSASVVQDWMFTHNFGVFAENPTLSQWRGQMGYAFGPWNEVGLWGTWRGQGDTKDVTSFGPTRWVAVQQLNAYWHYKWGQGGADTWLWFGVPEHVRLAGGGSLGDYLAGALANCPLGEWVSLYSLVTYMHPSAAPGPLGSNDGAWNFSIGLSFFPGRNARTSTVAGQCWMPQLPVANNGYFLLDTSQTY